MYLAYFIICLIPRPHRYGVLLSINIIQLIQMILLHCWFSIDQNLWTLLVLTNDMNKFVESQL